MPGGMESFISKDRIEALVDGVFAFAMTLLVISLAITPPIPAAEAARTLPGVIAGMWPAFMSFLIAFFILGSYWVLHHREFHLLHSADEVIVRLTLLILVCVVLVPFTTSVSGDYSSVQLAVILFHLNLFALAMSFYIQWRYIVRAGHLTTRAVEDGEAAQLSGRLLLSAGVALLGIAVSFVSPGWSMAVYLLLFFRMLVRRGTEARGTGTG